ncbi:MAG: riboflavin synthase [Candidatus Eisenbacteria bacterium]
MFTGLVEELGEIVRIEERAPGRRFWVRAREVLADTRVGDSLAVNGCCLTTVERQDDRFVVDVVPETLARTTLGEWKVGERVNLERALRLDQRLGGHLVQGHVDGVGTVGAVAREGEGRRLTLAVPGGLARFVAEKGSLAVDGVSLTIARAWDGGEAGGTGCEIALIPHTLEKTIAGGYAPGRRVNLEADLIARYAARLLEESVASRRPS